MVRRCATVVSATRRLPFVLWAPMLRPASWMCLVDRHRVTSNGIGAFDVQSTSSSASSRPRGRIIDRVYKRIAYESIIGTAIAAMTNHRGFRTRPSTMSTDSDSLTGVARNFPLMIKLSLICQRDPIGSPTWQSDRGRSELVPPGAGLMIKLFL